MNIINISNNLGLTLKLSPIGASIYDILLPDKNGIIESITLRPEDYNEFANSLAYNGKTVGRTCGRIKDGNFTLNGINYHIDSVDKNGLHGGNDSFSFKEFTYNILDSDSSIKVIFEATSSHLEAGFPGNITLKVIYTLLKNENKFRIDFEAISDLDTLCNITNHTYFNLSGNLKDDILNHDLLIKADTYGYVDSNSIPSKIIPVGIEYNFNTLHKIKDYIHSEVVLENTKGYDNPFVLSEKENALTLKDNKSGRSMTISTNYDVIVCYTDNFPAEAICNNNISNYENLAIAIEPSFFPNSINSDFIENKKDILRANQKFSQFIEYSFNIE